MIEIVFHSQMTSKMATDNESKRLVDEAIDFSETLINDNEKGSQSIEGK